MQISDLNWSLTNFKYSHKFGLYSSMARPSGRHTRFNNPLPTNSRPYRLRVHCPCANSSWTSKPEHNESSRVIAWCLMGRGCGKNHENITRIHQKVKKKLIDSTILGWPQQHGHTPAKMFHSDVQNCFCELRGLSCWPSLCFVESLNHPEKDDAVQLLRRCRASKDPLKTRHLALVPETASLGNLYQQLSGAKMGLATVPAKAG